VVVALCTVVGARFLSAATTTTTVWAAAHDLSAGTVLTAGDLQGVEVNLGDTAGRYLGPASGATDGRELVDDLAAGDLLGVSDLQPAPDGRIVVVGVAPERLPPGVTHGSVVDLYLTTGGGGAADPVETELVHAAVPVQSVTAPDVGGLSGAASNTYQLAVLLPADEADELVRTLPRGEPIVVLVSGR
jgi:hypothetical protein